MSLGDTPGDIALKALASWRHEHLRPGCTVDAAANAIPAATSRSMRCATAPGSRTLLAAAGLRDRPFDRNNTLDVPYLPRSCQPCDAIAPAGTA